MIIKETGTGGEGERRVVRLRLCMRARVESLRNMGWKSHDDRGQRFSRMVRWLVAGAPHMGTQEY